MEAIIKGLRTYARERVEANRGRIIANLSARRGEAAATCGRVLGGPLVIDVALPGAAYFSVAAGGLAEVLHLLGKEHVCVDRFVGASGGACSLFLILANQRDHSVPPSSPAAVAGAGHAGIRCPSSELLLRSYLQYGESEGCSSVRRSLNALWQGFAGVSSFWEHKYRELLQHQAAFKAIQDRAFVAVAGKPIRRQAMGLTPRSRNIASRGPPSGSSATPTVDDQEDFEAASDNYVLHDFETVEQAVQAFVATGEATGRGLLRGIPVFGAGEHCGFSLLTAGAGLEGQAMRRIRLLSRFCDGGHPVAPQLLQCQAFDEGGQDPCCTEVSRKDNALLYYCTWFEEGSDAIFCTTESVERLFRKGVDRTIECLCNPGLITLEPGSGAKSKPAPDKMVIALPGVPLCASLGRIGRAQDLAHGAFVSVRKHEVVEVTGP